jgi:hypothetical protein
MSPNSDSEVPMDRSKENELDAASDTSSVSHRRPEEAERVTGAATDRREALSAESDSNIQFDNKLKVEPRVRESGILNFADVASAAGIWGALIALPLFVVGSLSINLASKLVWLVSVTLLCMIATTMIKAIIRLAHASDARKPGAIVEALIRTSRNTQATLLLLISAFVFILVATFPLAALAESRAATFPITSCLEVGAGQPDYAPAFRAAYERHGGVDELGCALNNVTRIENGFHQNFRGKNGGSTIFATEPGRALVLTGDFAEGFPSIANGDGVKATVQAGYPIDEGVRKRDGLMLRVGAGGFKTSVVVKKEGGRWIWVQPVIWELYQKYGGPEGALGYPTGDATPIDNTADLKQTFEYGSLCFENGVGIRC